MAYEEMPKQDIIDTLEQDTRSTEILDQQQLQEIFRLLTEVHLALHMAMHDDARHMKEMEHAAMIRQQHHIEEHANPLPVEHPIAA
jgi:hypothetical protein